MTERQVFTAMAHFLSCVLISPCDVQWLHAVFSSSQQKRQHSGSCQFVSRGMLVWRWYSEANIYLGLSCLFILCCFSSCTRGNKQQVHFLVGKWWLDFSVSSLSKRIFGSWFLPRATTFFFFCMIPFSLLSFSAWFLTELQPSGTPVSWSATYLQGNP